MISSFVYPYYVVSNLHWVVYYCWHAEDLARLKVLHGVDQVMEGEAIVLTIKDQNVLIGDDVNNGILTLSGESWIFNLPNMVFVSLSIMFVHWIFIDYVVILLQSLICLQTLKIGEHNARNEAYKAAKKKTRIYDHK